MDELPLVRIPQFILVVVRSSHQDSCLPTRFVTRQNPAARYRTMALSHGGEWICGILVIRRDCYSVASASALATHGRTQKTSHSGLIPQASCSPKKVKGVLHTLRPHGSISRVAALTASYKKCAAVDYIAARRAKTELIAECFGGDV